MATFPSIVPSSRLLITGDFPNVLQSSLSGVTTGYRRGNRRVEQVLQLSFAHLTETQVNLIRTHFDGQSGSFENFFLTSSTFAWIYSTPPTITDSIPSRWNVQVELKTVPLERGELVYDAGDSSTTARSTILDALTSSSTPARTNIIDSGDSLLV